MKYRLVLPWLLLVAVAAGATRSFVLDTPQTLAGSRSLGVAISPDGGLQAIPPLVTVAIFQEPIATALAEDRQGTLYVGTGHPARLYQIRSGQSQLLAELAADQITSLSLGSDGTLYVTTALPATLASWKQGKLTQLANLPEGNFWDTTFFRGKLVVAAGNPGRLFTLGPKGLELLAELPDRHGRCLLPSGDKLIIGTSGKGLILTFDGQQVGVLYDSAFTEIASLAAAPDGTVFAAALTGDPTLGKKGGETPAGVSVTTGPSPKEKGSAVSEILKVSPQGAVTTLHRFDRDLATTLAWQAGSLLVGTGLEGKLIQITEGAVAQLDTVDASQVSKLSSSAQALLTQGPVKLLVRRGEARGVFTTPVLDAQQPAQWGRLNLWFQGRCQVRFRSGNTKAPGETWSNWSEAVGCGSVPVAAPVARYLQVQLELGPGASRVDRLEVPYRQVNLPPAIKELKVYPPGEVYLKAPPPSERIVELTHPELSGIFTTLEDDKGNQTQLGKKYYRVGFQTVSWKVEDPNGDPLLFTVEVQRQGGPWWPVRRNLESVQLALDTQALADGFYRFRLTASDLPANPEAPATTSQVSSWFTVDNTPPEITVRREGSFWVIAAKDELSPITLAQWNRDAQEWQALAPEDGVLDSLQERFLLPVKKGPHILSFRVVDRHHNRRVVAVEELP